MVSVLGLCSTTLFLLLITASAPAAIMAEEFKVGSDEGWRVPAATETDMYTRWAQTLRFHVGDSLRKFFNYNFCLKTDTNVVSFAMITIYYNIARVI